MAQRRQVHRVLHHAELQIVAHLPGNLDADRLLRLGRRSGDVRRQNHVAQVRIRRILRRLYRKHVERRPGHVAALERSTSAASSTNSPRAQLMMRTPFFIAASVFALITPAVCGVSPTCSVM